LSLLHWPPLTLHYFLDHADSITQLRDAAPLLKLATQQTVATAFVQGGRLLSLLRLSARQKVATDPEKSILQN
jgi:hypothetical protein